ncbi:probable serine/threonine-protein kinase DDB_G0282963 [Panonychus citri]|uniref:probable serine/threonine-protein kinase DDB_G0282963 n=1 Tax=Panonychus citri TaxID=50023 RepID=UPI002306E201|nr:probable serine/threonine-protein kinase DDB_G0282963 [Panonychus citri]
MVIFGLQRLLILIFSFLLFFFQFSLGIYSVKSIDSGVEFGSAASRSNTPSPPTINEERSTAASPIAIEINNNHVETIKGNINNNDSNVNNNQINGLTIIHKDEGIDMDETIDFIIDDPIQTIAEKARRIVFKCTWRGCGVRCDLIESIEKHIRTIHLGRSENASEEENDHEEEFYYAEIEEEMETENIIISSKDSSSSNDSSLGLLSPVLSSSESPHSTNYNLSPTLSSASSLLFFAPSPTWSHLDMARPPHEDPEYQAQQKQLQLQLQLQQQQQQQQIQIQNQQVQNFNQQQQQQKPSPSSSSSSSLVTQTIASAQLKPEPERKTVISSPINIPGISVAHRWSTKMRDSSSSYSPFSATSCNSSYSFSNSHHHHHHHFNHHHHHQHQSQASLLASSSSPVNFFSPKAPSKVMRLSSNTSSPINIKSSGNNTNPTLTGTITISGTNKTNSNTVTSIISSSNNNPTLSTNTTTNANNNASSNQWTSLLQSSSTSLSASSLSSSTSSPSTTGIATTLLKGSSISPTRRTRTETRKCRKVYGMDNRDSWCTQCKWKKACTRFVD